MEILIAVGALFSIFFIATLTKASGKKRANRAARFKSSMPDIPDLPEVIEFSGKVFLTSTSTRAMAVNDFKSVFKRHSYGAKLTGF